MKVRLGYVTNSSSSSYLIAFRGDLSSLRNQLLQAFALPEGHPLAGTPIAEELVDFLVDAEETYRSTQEFINAQKVEGNWYGSKYTDEQVREDYPEAIKLLDAGFTLVRGRTSTDYGSSFWSRWLCDNGLHYYSDDLIVEAYPR